MTQLYRNAEKSKEREYSQRIREVEHGDFNPLVFTTAGGAAPQSTRVIKHLAAKIRGVHRSKPRLATMPTQFRTASNHPTMSARDQAEETNLWGCRYRARCERSKNVPSLIYPSLLYFCLCLFSLTTLLFPL